MAVPLSKVARSISIQEALRAGYIPANAHSLAVERMGSGRLLLTGDLELCHPERHTISVAFAAVVNCGSALEISPSEFEKVRRLAPQRSPHLSV